MLALPPGCCPVNRIREGTGKEVGRGIGYSVLVVLRVFMR
jgi:hypothetical protein